MCIIVYVNTYCNISAVFYSVHGCLYIYEGKIVINVNKRGNILACSRQINFKYVTFVYYVGKVYRPGYLTPRILLDCLKSVMLCI